MKLELLNLLYSLLFGTALVLTFWGLAVIFLVVKGAV